MGVRRLRSSISLSLLVHAFFVAACILLLQQRTTHLASPFTLVELEPLPKIPKKTDDAALKRQIVQTSPGTKVEKALPDAFLGQQTQAVDRQTVSKEHQTAMGHMTQPRVKSDSDAAKKMAQKKGEGTQLKKLQTFGLPILPAARAPGAPVEEQDQPNWASIGGLPQDFIKGLKESERTALNTKEYVFYGYFQRIRERLDRAWVPILREKLAHYYRSGRTLASDMDHTTKVMVTLNQQGEIIRVQVLNESGTQDLDDAAINAFNNAGPFPNPPKGIVDTNGTIQIPWEFILKT